jgi:hypothetical protein
MEANSQRQGVQRLPRGGRTQAGVECEQLEEDGRARAGRARDDDRSLHPLVGDAGPLRAGPRHEQPGTQGAQQLLPRHQPPHGVQPRGVEALHDPREALAPVAVAEVSEPSGADRIDRAGEELVGVDGDRVLRAADGLAHGVDATHPGRPLEALRHACYRSRHGGDLRRAARGELRE